jgi:alkylation response protein AidB-like acyl-CoA dehydrogenase
MTFSHSVAVITSDEQALIVASDLAEDLRRDSALRDRERRLPYPELEVFSRSGLWGISVPREYGGAGVSNVTLAKVIALIAQADGSLGQIPQNHFYALEVLRVNGSEAQKNACTPKCSPASVSAMPWRNWGPRPPMTGSPA